MQLKSPQGSLAGALQTQSSQPSQPAIAANFRTRQPWAQLPVTVRTSSIASARRKCFFVGRMFQPGGVRYGVPMRGLKFKPAVGGAPGLAFAVGIACLLRLAPASAQVGDAPQDKPANTRLLTAEEGRSIANAALRQDQPVPGTLDCSHIIHQIYTEAGFEYAYASSFELYAGDDNFTRVRTPHSGDLIVWPGHVGIVVDPDQHNFSSLVSTGFDVQD